MRAIGLSGVGRENERFAIVRVQNRREHMQGLSELLAVSRLGRPRVDDPFLDSASVGPGILDQLTSDSFVRLDRLYELGELSDVGRALDCALADPEQVLRPRRATASSSTPSVEQLEQVEKLSDRELAEGPTYWRQVTSSVSLRDPLVAVPGLLNLVLHPTVLGAVQSYLAGFPSLTYVKVVRTWANKLPDFDTQLWHVDFDSARMLKLFIFFHDINAEMGGTTFVEGSHLFEGKIEYDYRDRWSTAELERDFPSSRVRGFDGRFGDAFLLDTNMVHRGVRPILGDRTVVIANYMLHEETLSDGQLRIDPASVLELHPVQQLALQVGPIT